MSDSSDNDLVSGPYGTPPVDTLNLAVALWQDPNTRSTAAVLLQQWLEPLLRNRQKQLEDELNVHEIPPAESSGDHADEGTAYTLATQASAHKESLRGQIAQILDLLQLMETGEWGKCHCKSPSLSCQTWIHPERLVVQPTATMCQECANCGPKTTSPEFLG